MAVRGLRRARATQKYADSAARGTRRTPPARQLRKLPRPQTERAARGATHCAKQAASFYAALLQAAVLMILVKSPYGATS
jgi:hypothetical protein